MSIDVLLNVPEYDWYARIAPIPFNETISIDLPEAATIMVYDMAGQKIRSFHGLSLGRQWLSLPELPSGVYFMIVKMDKSNQAIRIIKQ